MIMFKKVVLNIFFTIFIIELVYSMRLSGDQKKCRDKLYATFGWIIGEQYQTRSVIPKKIFKDLVYNELKCETNEDLKMAQKLIMYNHDVIKPIDGTSNMKEWCESHFKTLKINEDSEQCFERLCVNFINSDNATEILRDAYLNLSKSSFVNTKEINVELSKPRRKTIAEKSHQYRERKKAKIAAEKKHSYLSNDQLENGYFDVDYNRFSGSASNIVDVKESYKGITGFIGFKYFKYLFDSIDPILEKHFMTPVEVCQGKTKAVTMKRTLSKKKRDEEDTPAGSSKARKMSSTSDPEYDLYWMIDWDIIDNEFSNN